MASSADAQTTRQSGYVTMADGTQLRYTVERPGGSGRFPVAMNYDGYCAGTGATSCNDPHLSAELLKAGYAVLGVSVRGTGCSTGTFDFRDPQANVDGAAVVTWASRQSWSNGRVGLYGDSFPGLTQPGIAALRPTGLAAIAPFQIVDDVYRDVGYPGGILNAEFASFWGLANQPASAAQNPGSAAQQGDLDCSANYAGNNGRNGPSNIFLKGAQHPWYDAYWKSKEVGAAATRIDVPTFGCVSWQDDEVGSRPAWSLFRNVNPAKLWMLGTNGYHGMCDLNNDIINADVVRFFDRFVRGTNNGWERTPRSRIWHEATANKAGKSVPSWVSSSPVWPPATSTRALLLGAGGLLTSSERSVTGPADSYRAPAPSAATEEGVVLGQNNRLWQRPVPPGGALAWTTPALAADAEVFGPASADLWLASTGTDTDIQVTLTEVRPDGMETYVARGWLRASRRALDPAASSATRPQQTHTEGAARPLVPGTPTLVRVEVFPFNHVFRTGSRIRMIVDTPSQTGGWNFSVLPTPVTNTVLHDATHRSRLTLGILSGRPAPKALPACDTLLNQPCRVNAYPLPQGKLMVSADD